MPTAKSYTLDDVISILDHQIQVCDVYEPSMIILTPLAAKEILKYLVWYDANNKGV